MFVREQKSPGVSVEAKWMALALLISLLMVGLVVQVAGGDEPIKTAEPVYIHSPWCGIFRAAEELGARPFVEVGSPVEPGTVVGMIDDIMVNQPRRSFPVPAGVTGTISKVLVVDGQIVEIGDPLFEVIPSEEIALR